MTQGDEVDVNGLNDLVNSLNEEVREKIINVRVNNEYVVIRGERGRPKEINSVIKSNNSVDLINYAENIGAEPFLFVGEIIKVKNWVYCVG